MTHASSFRYGQPLAFPTGGPVRVSPVRVSYFDPVTGEPCDSKPVPRGARRAKPTNAQREAARIAEAEARRKAEKEGEEIAEGMRARAVTPARSVPCNSKPVVADGTLYESIGAAARAIGCHVTSLGVALRKGKATCKGHAVAYAEEVGR